jgi:hypothetical protein
MSFFNFDYRHENKNTEINSVYFKLNYRTDFRQMTNVSLEIYVIQECILLGKCTKPTPWNATFRQRTFWWTSAPFKACLHEQLNFVSRRVVWLHAAKVRINPICVARCHRMSHNAKFIVLVNSWRLVRRCDDTFKPIFTKALHEWQQGSML